MAPSRSPPKSIHGISGSNTFAGVNTFTNATNSFVGTFAGDGVGLSNLVVVAGNVFGSIPMTQLSGILPSSLLAGTYSNALTFNNPANSFTGDGAGLADVNAAALEGSGAASFWQLGGNAGTTPGVDFLGTTDTNALELKVNNQRAFRLEPTTNSPNLIGGWSSNAVHAGVFGATIIGGGTEHAEISFGGAVQYFTNLPNRVLIADNMVPHLATVGGGAGNIIARSALSTIAGGAANSILGTGYRATAGHSIRKKS